MGYTTTGLPFSEDTTSRDAALKAEKFVGKQGQDVLAYLVERGARGASQKEADRDLRIGRPSCCARFNALEKAGHIFKGTEIREGCRVYFVTVLR